MKSINNGPILNIYPDSLGGTLSDVVCFLGKLGVQEAFQSVYILPSLYHTDLDRGFSVIDYELNRLLATQSDLEDLKTQGIGLKLDFILNHASVLSPQFQSILEKGDDSLYRDFFIDWNAFWAGKGEMTEEGYIQPDPELIKDMFFRKPGLPILMVRFPDGTEVPYWNTFYQEVQYTTPTRSELEQAANLQYGEAEAVAQIIKTAYDKHQKPNEIDFGRFSAHRESLVSLLESRREYLGQMDLNIKSPLVWEFYAATLKRLANYGAQIVRLDAFAYASKEPGRSNFLNDPETWEVLHRIRELADPLNLTLLPEIHARYKERVHEKIAEQGYLVYDFFLPGLIIDAFERQTTEALLRWIHDIQTKNIRTVNMLGCHDGIPLLDLEGLLTGDQIQNLIQTVINRGGYVKDLHGKKNIYYQVNATYYSALGEEDQRLLLARAIQIFMPGIPQVWYLDLFAGKNNYSAVESSGSGGHKEINRTNLTWKDVQHGLTRGVVEKQLLLLQFRNSCRAFGPSAELTVLPADSHILLLQWKQKGYTATLEADLRQLSFRITETDGEGNLREIM